ncbi:MAG TPA: hypothetical protein PLM09_10125, partial [Casimicrobiaceae bacterium]|nr:hypothetical protein [Casimicrobiaceae bacterium]
SLDFTRRMLEHAHVAATHAKSTNAAAVPPAAATRHRIATLPDALIGARPARHGDRYNPRSSRPAGSA